MKLFDPITIRNMDLKNRIVMAPMVTGLGFTSKQAQAYYLERIKGGVGAILLGGFQSDALRINSIARKVATSLVEPAHEWRVKIGPQIWYGNYFPSFGSSDPEFIAPSSGTPPEALGLLKLWGKDKIPECRELTRAEIRDIIHSYAEAASRAREVGFDFVEVHGCHGHNLPSQFFSPRHNHRGDEYGGDLMGRMRFNVEVARAMREAMGDDFPFFWRLSAEDGWPGGIVLEDSIELSRQLVAAGVDVIDVSFGCEPGSDYDLKRTAAPLKKERMGTFVPLAHAIKKALGIPVVAVGRINSPRIAEGILADGRADLIAIGRQLLCDPFWPDKVARKQWHKIQYCKSCNFCVRVLHDQGKPIQCKQNPRLGREAEIPL